MRWGVVVLSLLAAMLIVAGCGGGGSTGGGSSAGGTEKEGPVTNEEAATGAEEGKEGEKGEAEEGKEGEEKPSPAKAAFIKEGDQVCSTVPQNYNQKLKALEKKNGGKKPSTQETNLKAAVPPLYTAVEEFEALSAPSGEEAEVEAIIDALEAAAKGLEAKPESELSGPKSPFAEFQKLTGEYGFQVCSQL
jgi:hypothetical protein